MERSPFLEPSGVRWLPVASVQCDDAARRKIGHDDLAAGTPQVDARLRRRVCLAALDGAQDLA
jgi:hypothetical protein